MHIVIFQKKPAVIENELYEKNNVTLKSNFKILPEIAVYFFYKAD